MNTRNIKPEKLPDMDGMMHSEKVESFRKQIYELQFEVDILKETINVLKKKTPGVIGQNVLVTSPSNSEIQMTCVALPIPQHLPMWR